MGDESMIVTCSGGQKLKIELVGKRVDGGIGREKAMGIWGPGDSDEKDDRRYWDSKMGSASFRVKQCACYAAALGGVRHEGKWLPWKFFQFYQGVDHGACGANSHKPIVKPQLSAKRLAYKITEMKTPPPTPPPTSAHGAVRARGGARIKAGKAFVPEVYFPLTVPTFAKASPSGWYPICHHYFADNNYGATVICKSLNFASGTIKKTNEKNKHVDAFPIGKCSKADADGVADTVRCNGRKGNARATQYGFFSGDGVHIGAVSDTNPLKSLWGGCKAGNSRVIKVTCSN